MCRWAAWLGAPVYMSDVIVTPERALIHQSRDALKCKTSINADGFGLAWYNGKPEPGLYRDVHPAWSDANLKSITEQIQSRLFMAHVRASTGTATSRNNCHPFVHHNWSFMHNGQIGGFEKFRKTADMMIDEKFYTDRKGATDSEALFLVACGLNIEQQPKRAMELAVAGFERIAHQHGKAPYVRLSAALTDGQTLYAMRYASDPYAPSLFYQWNEAWQGWAVVSEPYRNATGTWKEVPKGSFCTFTAGNVEIEPFVPIWPQKVAV